MDDREFWIAFRRWLKGRIAADQQMVAAIERRFEIGDNAGTKGRQRQAPVVTR
jgi:hypothetical protein